MKIAKLKIENYIAPSASPQHMRYNRSNGYFIVRGRDRAVHRPGGGA